MAQLMAPQRKKQLAQLWHLGEMLDQFAEFANTTNATARERFTTAGSLRARDGKHYSAATTPLIRSILTTQTAEAHLGRVRRLT